MEDLLYKILFSLLKHVGADSGYFIHKQQQQLLVLAKAEAAEKHLLCMIDKEWRILMLICNRLYAMFLIVKSM